MDTAKRQKATQAGCSFAADQEPSNVDHLYGLGELLHVSIPSVLQLASLYVSEAV